MTLLKPAWFIPVPIHFIIASTLPSIIGDWFSKGILLTYKITTLAATKSGHQLGGMDPLELIPMKTSRCFVPVVCCGRGVRNSKFSSM